MCCLVDNKCHRFQNIYFYSIIKKNIFSNYDIILKSLKPRFFFIIYMWICYLDLHVDMLPGLMRRAGCQWNTYQPRVHKIQNVSLISILRATPMGVAIRGAIPITVKMTPQKQNIRLQWRWH